MKPLSLLALLAPTRAVVASPRAACTPNARPPWSPRRAGNRARLPFRSAPPARSWPRIWCSRSPCSPCSPLFFFSSIRSPAACQRVADTPNGRPRTRRPPMWGPPPCALHGDYPAGSRLAVEYPPGWPISLAGAVVIRTICDLPIICDRVTLAVAWLVAELSAVPLAAKGTNSVQTNAGRCHVGGPNRVGHLASGQLAALVQQFDRKLVKLGPPP
jgi:hypothetical protein